MEPLERTVYPDLLRRLLALISRFEARQLSVASFQAEINAAEGLLCSLEDRETRAHLLSVEAALELLRFTVTEADQPTRAQPIVANLRDHLRGRLGGE